MTLRLLFAAMIMARRVWRWMLLLAFVFMNTNWLFDVVFFLLVIDYFFVRFAAWRWRRRRSVLQGIEDAVFAGLLLVLALI